MHTKALQKFGYGRGCDERRPMKAMAKTCAEIIAMIVVLPMIAYYQVASLVSHEGRAFPGCSQALCLLPGFVGVYLRRAFYRFAFRKCGDNSWIGFGSVFSHPECTLGHSVYVGCFCCLGEVTLDDNVLIGSHVSITNGSAQHGTARLDVPVREQPGTWPHVTIGCDTWIGDRAVVMVDVGRHCIVGAGSVVTKPVPDYAVVAGVPACIVRYRNLPSDEFRDAASASAPSR